MTKPVVFYSAGLRLAGYLHEPVSTAARVRRPGIVVCTGFGAVQAFYIPEICDALAAAGYVALRFDYRGFGESAGEAGRIVPMDHVADIRCAITYLEQQPGVDPEAIGLYGTSFGGAHVSYTAGVDERVRCTVATVGIGHGGRWMRSLRRYWEWEAFKRRIAEDRAHRVLTGTSSSASPYEIMVRDPCTESIHAERQKQFPGSVVPVPFECAEAIVEYAPESVVDRIAPRAILWIHAADDELVPPEESRFMYERACEPKKLVLLPGLGHYDVYSGEAFRAVMRESLAWYERYLPVPG